jgi:hypothetical protein
MTQPESDPKLGALGEPVRSVGVECPYCGEQFKYPEADYYDKVLMARVACPSCKREFLIVDDQSVTQEEYERRSAA